MTTRVCILRHGLEGKDHGRGLRQLSSVARRENSKEMKRKRNQNRRIMPMRIFSHEERVKERIFKSSGGVVQSFSEHVSEKDRPHSFPPYIVPLTSRVRSARHSSSSVLG